MKQSVAEIRRDQRFKCNGWLGPNDKENVKKKRREEKTGLEAL